MNANPSLAMVLAAGHGKRMRPITKHTPKPLIEVAGKALIDYALDRLKDAGVDKAVVNVHYLADQVEAHLAQRRKPEIIISDERTELLETGGGLKKARAYFGCDPIFCTNTDAILLDEGGAESCAMLTNLWSKTEMDALLLLVPIGKTSGYDGAGDFEKAPDGRISFRTEDTAPYVFTGLQIISPSLIDEGPGGAFSTKQLWDIAAARGRLYGAVHSGSWLHVGDPEGLVCAEQKLSSGNE